MNKLIINCLPRMNVLGGYYGLHVDMPPHHKINTSGSLSPISSFSAKFPGQKGLSPPGRGEILFCRGKGQP